MNENEKWEVRYVFIRVWAQFLGRVAQPKRLIRVFSLKKPAFSAMAGASAMPAMPPPLSAMAAIC